MVKNKLISIDSSILYDSGWITAVGNSLQATYWGKIADVACDVKVLKRVSATSLNETIVNSYARFQTGASHYYNGAVRVADGSCITSASASIYMGETYVVKPDDFITTTQNNALTGAADLSDLITTSVGAGTQMSITSDSTFLSSSMSMDFRVVFLKPKEKFL